MALLHLEDGQDDVVGSNRLTQQLYYRRDANQSEDRSKSVEDGRRILRSINRLSWIGSHVGQLSTSVRGNYRG